MNFNIFSSDFKNMLINIYSPQLSTRLEYVLQFVIIEVCGLTYKIYTDENQYLNALGPKLNYSNSAIDPNEISMYNHGFLYDRGIKIIQPLTRSEGEQTEIFPGESGDIPFDIFSSIFYFLSRYEEYLPFEKDAHGRFEANQSFAYRHQLLEIPIVDIYIQRLQEKLKSKFPEIICQEQYFKVVPSIDIDQAYLIKEKNSFRFLALCWRAIRKADVLTLRKMFEVRYTNASDPYDVYDEFDRIHMKHNLIPIYFILYSKKKTKFDININRKNRAFRKLIQRLANKANIGIHPSYYSKSNTKIIEEEVHYLSATSNQAINTSRQHFLKMRMPYTYKSLISIGIEHEYTMGFASMPGFRAGTSRSFRFYDLKQEQISFLYIHPFVLMDATYKYYLKYSPEESYASAQKIIDQIAKVKGQFIPLWHNESMSDFAEWKGWAGLYEKIIQYACQHKG